MSRKASIPAVRNIPRFDRRLFESDEIISRIGGGAIGGKATGLAYAHSVLLDQVPGGVFEGLVVTVPRLVVIGTDVFDAFMSRNDLYDLALDETADDRIANAFQRADFPAECAGDLRALISSVHSPLAVRSSSMLEDAMYEPFAGVYETKMTPNNQPDTDARYRKLVEAVKFVYSSTFFREAKAYMAMTGRSATEEKMAVIIQEVVGGRYGDRFYPTLAGVARSYNFYPFGHARPEDGIVDLALGLGKTIVDGGLVWTYCPAYPDTGPPVAARELLKHTQTEFWAVNMGKSPAFDPVRETEYLVRHTLAEAEYDASLTPLASTYQAQNDRLVPGIGSAGPRVLDFAPLLRFSDIPFNTVVTRLLTACSRGLETAVEMEFAMVIDPRKKAPPRFGLLQVRPMVVSDAQVEVTDAELTSDRALVASERVLGNGTVTDLSDVVYVKPDAFKKEHTRTIALEIDALNRRLVETERRYVLIGFGRWGSSDPWLGIPVNWGNISGARVLVEATTPEMDIELSQGSHFFHNLTSLQLSYFNVRHSGPYRINWSWLQDMDAFAETDYVRHVKLKKPLTVTVDGRAGRGVILV